MFSLCLLSLFYLLLCHYYYLLKDIAFTLNGHIYMHIFTINLIFTCSLVFYLSLISGVCVIIINDLCIYDNAKFGLCVLDFYY